MEDTAEHPVSGHRNNTDEGFALLSVLLLILVFAAVSVLMLGAVIAQVKPTVFEAKSARTIIAAESGIDATLSQFRTATKTADAFGDVYGDPTRLPCAVTGTGKEGVVAGTVGGGSTTLRYDVTIRYFDTTPANRDATWRSTWAKPCSAGGGLLNPPNFALITSVGSDAAVAGYAATVGNRTLESVYTFQVSASAINGGVIYAFNDAYCLQASSRTVGATISYVEAKNCRRDDPSRLWSYVKDYKIHLSATDLAGAGPSLCITDQGDPATLQVCDVVRTGSMSQKQMFSWEGGARWRGMGGNCLGSGLASLAAGTPLKVTGCQGNDLESGSFNPDPRVGPGAASYAKNQVVNFLEFGRCFDVTDEDVLSPEMIIYPCKQDPAGDGANLFWNHRWYYTEPASNEVSKSGPIKVHNDGSKGVHADYCLTTPEDGGIYPTLSTPCDESPRQTWKRTTQAATYADSWLFTDTFGHCLALGEKLSSAKPWSKMIVAKCNGQAEQKWNAPASAQSASLDNYKELFAH